MRVELPHAFAKFVLELPRIGLGPQIDVHEAEMGALEIWEVGLRRGSLTQISVFNVRGHCLHVVHKTEALSDRISAQEVLLGKALVDDSDSIVAVPRIVGRPSIVARPHIILRSEGASCNYRNTDRRKVV